MKKITRERGAPSDSWHHGVYFFCLREMYDDGMACLGLGLA